MTPEEFRKKVSALGFKFFKRADISAAHEEIPWVESLFEGYKIDRKTEWSHMEGKGKHARKVKRTKLKLVGSAHGPPEAKAAFENDPEFVEVAKIRDEAVKLVTITCHSVFGD